MSHNTKVANIVFTSKRKEEHLCRKKNREQIGNRHI